jgi:hypothetical protein
VDAKGDVFIADSGDNVVREITADGVIHRFAGTGIAGLGVAGPTRSRSTSSSSRLAARFPMRSSTP